MNERGRLIRNDAAPGEERAVDGEVARGFRSYAIGLVLAAVLTIGSFCLPQSTLVWEPAIPVALAVFAIAQMGVHLVFFLHLTSAPDHTNNALALAFGVMVVVLVLGGSLWITANLDHHRMPDHEMIGRQR